MVNEKNKDRLFRKIFGYEKYKENLLSLYNALNNTNHTNVNDLEITTIDDVIFMGMKNDVSCIIDSRMPLYEHQSTFNPNMPLRGLMYFGKLYDKYIKKNKSNIYSSKLIKVPTPQYYVFYNGAKDYPDIMELKLSDAFQIKQDSGKFEWTAVMLNINFGRNKNLMERCKILREYAILIKKIREYQNTFDDIEQAVNAAVDKCIEENVLAEFLLEHKSEVISMCLTEYNEKETMEMFKEEYFAAGEMKGKAESIIELLKDIGTVSEELKSIVMHQEDMAVLKQWLKLSAKVSSIEEFREEAGV